MIPYSFLCGQGEHQSPRYIEVIEDRLRQLLRPILAQVEVDEDWYLDQNRDVAAAIAAGVFASARNHYMEAGYFEDRFPRPFVVDERWYITQYGDVADAIQRGTFRSAQQHFLISGFREGRLPHPGWSLAGGQSYQAGIKRTAVGQLVKG
jgi:hypothetical protein